MSDSLMNQAPSLCKDPVFIFESGWVEKPYKGVNQERIFVRSAFDNFEGFASTIDKDTPPDGLGYGSADESAFRDALKDRARLLRFAMAEPPNKQTWIRNAAKRAITLLGETESAYYNFPHETPQTPGEIIANENHRAAIRQKYRDAAELTRCAEYLHAQSEAEQANRQIYEDEQETGPVFTKATVQPFPTFDIKSAQGPVLQAAVLPTSDAQADDDEDTYPQEEDPFGGIDDEPTTQPTDSEPTSAKKSSSMPILIGLGALGVVSVFLLSRK